MSAAVPPVFPLNEFQRLMRCWDQIQPFSGIDAIEANGPVDADRLRAAAESEVAGLGVGYPVVTPDGTAVTYLPKMPSIPVETVHTCEGPAPAAALAERASSELSRPFGPGDPLLRLWVVCGETRSYIGMTWRHWPMDGVSAAHLFFRILARFVGAEPGSVVTATDLIVPDPAVLAPSWPRRQRLAVPIGESVRELFAYSRVYGVPRPRPERTALRVHLLELPQPVRPPGATLNDVIAAALFWALAEVLPERYRNHWRQRIQLINFVDLRPYGSADHARAWGQFLAHATLHMPEPRPAGLRALIESVRAQAVRSREGQYFFLSCGSHGIARAAAQWLPRRWRWWLPYALLPFTAALTNTRFRGEWNAGPFATRFGRSWRIAALGGFVPLTADVCSKGDQVSLALTCEEGGTMSEKIEPLKAALRAVLGGTVG
jgi:hypothetical protein